MTTKRSNVRSKMPAYGRTPKALIRDPTVSLMAKGVYAALDEIAGFEHVSVPRLGEWLGLSESSVRRSLYELRDSGWLVIEAQRDERGASLPNEYVLQVSPPP